MWNAPAAEAKITRVQITTRDTAFGGYSWPGVGQYERIVGVAFGEVDPTNPQNAIITDITLAPKNLPGNVEYSFDFYILKPLDLSKGNHKVMYEPPNRGGKTYASLARFSGGNDPASVTDPVVLANAFLLFWFVELVRQPTEKNRLSWPSFFSCVPNKKKNNSSIKSSAICLSGNPRKHVVFLLKTALIKSCWFI